MSNWGTSTEVTGGVKGLTGGWTITLVERRGALPLAPPLRAYGQVNRLLQHEHIFWCSLPLRINCCAKRLEHVLGQGGSHVIQKGRRSGPSRQPPLK